MGRRALRLYRIDGGWAVVRTVRDGQGAPLRVLKVGGVFQSATYFGDRRFDLPFEYMRAFDRLFDAERSGFRVRSMLCIGGGGCSYPKHVAATHPDVEVDVVERDGRVAAIARRHFFVAELEDAGRMSLAVDEGAHFLATSGRSYDAIVVDAFDGDALAAEFLEARVLTAAKERMAPGAMYVLNVVCEEGPEGAGQLQRAMEALAGAFANVHAVCATDEQLSDRDNFVLIATDGAYEFEGAFRL